ncbi:MAG: hypothetical protein BWX81_01606 [Spirochaetes bacterium ADurb.Bin110]|nr:MAG: hypothetical protein BWX81_01606 [Spirochaetes bacterium ADurb.Bin110]
MVRSVLALRDFVYFRAIWEAKVRIEVNAPRHAEGSMNAKKGRVTIFRPTILNS